MDTPSPSGLAATPPSISPARASVEISGAIGSSVAAMARGAAVKSKAQAAAPAAASQRVEERAILIVFMGSPLSWLGRSAARSSTRSSRCSFAILFGFTP
jgi:hypothetical protein